MFMSRNRSQWQVSDLFTICEEARLFELFEGFEGFEKFIGLPFDFAQGPLQFHS